MADLTNLPTELVSKLVLDLGKIPNISDKWINADVVSDLIEHYFQQHVNTTKINRVKLKDLGEAIGGVAGRRGNAAKDEGRLLLAFVLVAS